MTASLIRADLDTAHRFTYIKDIWKKLAGGKEIQFDMSVYLSEKNSAYRN